MIGSMLRIWFLATLALALAVPGAQALAATPTVDDDKCGSKGFPPCGYIWPTIGLEADTAFPYKTSQLPDLPKEVKVKVTYYWDMEQDGTGVPDDTEEMKITIVLSKNPQWLGAKVEPNACSFRLLPHQTHYDVCTVTVTLDPVLHPDSGMPTWPVTDAQLDLYGKRVMLFASSVDSGTFKKSYGVEDMRFKFDEAPSGGAPILGTESVGTENVEAPAPVLVPLVFSALALAALLRRRR